MSSRFALLLSLVLAPLAGCSKHKEQCEAVTAAVIAADQFYGMAKAAAERGDRKGFESARTSFDEQLKQLAGVTVDAGDDFLANYNLYQKEKYPAAASAAMVGWAKLLEKVEKDPELGKNFHGGVPYIGDEYSGLHVDAIAMAGSAACPK